MHKNLLELEKKHYIEAIKDAKEDVLRKIEDDFKIEYAHDAVHIEGKNSITLKEAYTLEKVDSTSRISETEQKELLNHLKAYDLIKKAVADKTPVTEDFIKDIHQQLLEDIMPGGLYRQVNVGLKGLHQPPDYVKVYDRMRRLMDDLDFNFKGTAIEKAAYIHLTIGKIHPFIDGNGRLGRLMMNYYLLLDGYLAISINDKVRKEYFEALDQFKLEKTMDKMVALIEKLLLERYQSVSKELN